MKKRNVKSKLMLLVTILCSLCTVFVSNIRIHADHSSDAMDRILGKNFGNFGSVQTCPTSLQKEVTRVLEIQQQAWNRGDIKGFMEHYWKSEKLTFSSEGVTRRSWKTTLERYQKRYPDRDAMGKLSFDHLEVTKLGENSALVLGEWHLNRKKDKPEGAFSLVMRKLKGKWVIVHDHTSSKPAE